ncbi:MAG: AzlD domain-containing protein [Alphaproteobacteria bacterium]|nr:AzlD domain-containing protein [Alphaproteobacteria bacterium]
MTPEILLALLAMAGVSYACRAGGFLMMRFVSLSSRRVRAWLNGIPIAIMGSILAPTLAKGGPAEWLGFAVAAIAMKATGSDLVAVAAAVFAVAVTRALA